MSPMRIKMERRERAVQHAIKEFSGGLALLMERNTEGPLEISGLAERFIEAVQRTAPPKPHPLLNAAMGGIFTLLIAVVALAYGYGVLNARVAQVEQLIPRVAEVEHKTQGIEVLSTKFDDLRRDIDRLLAVRDEKGK